LDALEREENEFIDDIRRKVLPLAPQPIGVAGASDDRKKSSATTAATTTPTTTTAAAAASAINNGTASTVAGQVAAPVVDLTCIPQHRPLFWSQHRSAVDNMRAAREGKEKANRQEVVEKSSSSSLSPKERRQTGGTNMDLSATSFSLDSVTSRTG